MTANLNIKRGDLHLTVAGAMNRGRYVLMTDGKGQPVEITVDLRERDDDGFGSEAESLAATDDHGAAIPAQTQNRFRPGPVVYEFAL